MGQRVSGGGQQCSACEAFSSTRPIGVCGEMRRKQLARGSRLSQRRQLRGGQSTESGSGSNRVLSLPPPPQRRLHNHRHPQMQEIEFLISQNSIN